MVAVFQNPLTAEEIKAKARELGADLVGIADGKIMDANPPDPRDPRRPSDITEFDGGRVIVMAKRYTLGTTRIARWDERHKYYNDELALTMLEEASLDLVYWLEDHGYPAIIVPPTHVDPWRYRGTPADHLSTLLSLNHAAVEAGLGTLGLNLQLLTPEYGPRVILTAVLTSVDCACDKPMTGTLCKGPECGRCLATCPGDVVGHWTRDWGACDRYRSPHGFQNLAEHLGRIFETEDIEAKLALLRSEQSFNLWQSILRGAGVVTGCRRCQDVCPVGADYEPMLKEALDKLPEDTPEKQARLAGMRAAEAKGDLPETYAKQRRWIGRLGYLDKPETSKPV
jgi:epoxyqueuosine reductase QueG